MLYGSCKSKQVKIKVLFFGISTDVVGTNALDFFMSGDPTVADFKEVLVEKYPSLTELQSYAIAVNEHYANDEIILKDQDVVAVIPPVSGG